MWENLKKAATDMLDGLESVPESIKKILHDLTHDIEEMESKKEITSLTNTFQYFLRFSRQANPSYKQKLAQHILCNSHSMNFSLVSS